ncbi:protein glass-like [Orbicella faveolata]|uniref:protein glass-like n=1 Tax=Orbicella faveolata TaxID=48498 RepID=UPI0009E2D723|nr:protein glass-like [Orbicella faveolata]
MASNNNPLPRAIFSPVPCGSLWGGSDVTEGECGPQQILHSADNQLNQSESADISPLSQGQPPVSDDPADAWFNAAGILLSLKHAAAERSARMGNPVEISQWNPSTSEPTIVQPQTTNVDAAAFLSNAIPNPDDPECPQDFYSGPIFQEETVQSQNDSSDEPGTKANKCRLCDKVYARPSTLRTHMRTHSGEKPYQCHICMKSFSQDANLTAHLRIHSGEKPFKCLVCDRRFAQSSSVTTHMRTHTGERPYRCKMCARGFADSSTLTKHLRTHTGEKPYKCKICQLKFSQSGNLNRHMRVHEHGSA